MITITQASIYDKAVEFASYEAGRGVQDDALYAALMINTRDKEFVQSFATQAAALLGGLLNFCLSDFATEEGNLTFMFREDCTLATKASTKRHLMEAISAYVMSRWLDNKLPDRAKAYATMYTDMASILVNSADRVLPKAPAKP